MKNKRKKKLKREKINFGKYGFYFIMLVVLFILTLSYLLMKDKVGKQEIKLTKINKELKKVIQEKENLTNQLRQNQTDKNMQKKALEFGFKANSDKYIIIKEIEMEYCD